MEQEEKDQFINDVSQDLLVDPPQDDETEALIDGLAQSELAGRIKNAAETFNLAQELDEVLLNEIGQEVMNGFEDDDKSRTDWLEDHAFWLSLYMQRDYAETMDPERSWGSTESIPILTEACDQFQSRTYKIFFPNDSFVSAIPMRKTVKDRKVIEDRAEKISQHMSYQLGYKDRSFRQDKDALFLGCAVHGSFFTKTYFSAKKKSFQVDNVRPTDFVVNYTVGPAKLEDLRRKSHIIYTTVGETERLVNEGFFVEAARPANVSYSDVYNIKVDEALGISRPDYRLRKDAQSVLIEQHLYLDLDDTGLMVPYVATVCAASRKVLRLTIGYEADENGNPLDDFKQIQYFTHYKYKENPDGFYGLGLGHTVGELNAAVNIMLRQSMDAATLANDGNMSGFISERLGLEGDEIRMPIGRFRKIPDTIGDIQNAIWTGQFPGPNAALVQIMESLDLRAQRLGSTTEATTGTTEKVEQPTTLLNKIEQALEAFSSVQMRLANSFSEELQKIYRINQKYLPFIDYFVVNGEPDMITRSDYADDMLIQPVFDPKYATQSQKIARARAELEATMENPVNQTRPQVIDAAFRRYLEALQVDDIDELIPPQPQIENFDDQYVENMFFLQPKESRPLFDVFPEQNHADHLAKMQELFAMIPQLGVELQPDQIEDLLKHKQKHEGYLYGQITGVVPSGQVFTPPLASRSDIPMDDAATTASISPPQSELLSQIVGGPAPGSGGAGGNYPPDEAR